MTRHSRSILIAMAVAVVASCAAPITNVPNANARAASNEPNRTAVNVSAAQPTNVVATPTPPPTPEPVVQINKDPKTLALAFYEFYVDGFPNMDDDAVSFAPYLTGRFFKEASKADDYDPFLDAQDMDETWKGNVSASEPVISGNKATVNVLLKGKTFKWTLKVSLLKQQGVWKIDGVKGITQ